MGGDGCTFLADGQVAVAARRLGSGGAVLAAVWAVEMAGKTCKPERAGVGGVQCVRVSWEHLQTLQLACLAAPRHVASGLLPSTQHTLPIVFSPAYSFPQHTWIISQGCKGLAWKQQATATGDLCRAGGEGGGRRRAVRPQTAPRATECPAHGAHISQQEGSSLASCLGAGRSQHRAKRSRSDPAARQQRFQHSHAPKLARSGCRARRSGDARSDSWARVLAATIYRTDTLGWKLGR